MALIETWGTWAQVDMGATANTTVYTVAASTSGVLKVRVTNRTGAAITIRLWVAVAAGADDDKQYELYEYSLASLDQITVTVVVGAGDLIRGRASAIGTSWVVKGVKLT